jgi:hypothetical protein
MSARVAEAGSLIAELFACDENTSLLLDTSRTNSWEVTAQ